MPHCMKCRHDIDGRFLFCPYCGQDQRPPGERKKAIVICSHEMILELPYCVLCGYSVLTGSRPERAGDLGMYRRAIGFAIASVLLFGAALFAMWVVKGAYGPAQSLIDQAEAGRSLSDPLAKKRGTDYLSMPLAIGAILCAVVAYVCYRKSLQVEDLD